MVLHSWLKSYGDERRYFYSVFDCKVFLLFKSSDECEKECLVEDETAKLM